MLTSLKDEYGRIITYCEWRLVGKSGFDKPKGEYIFIHDLWVHKDFNRTMRINRIIDEIMRIAPSANYCYFKRDKYNGRIKMYHKSYWEKRRRAYDPLITKES